MDTFNDLSDEPPPYNSLRKINFDFNYMMEKDLRPLLSMAPLLLSYPWPELKLLHFNGPFRLEELKTVLTRHDKIIDLHWNGHMMSGTWAELLDFVKDQKLKSVQFNHSNGSIYGAEIYWMSARDRMIIFSEVEVNRVGNLATLYIQGRRESNPVRDWADDTLESEGELS